MNILSEKISALALGISIIVLVVFIIQTTTLVEQIKLSNEQFSIQNRPWIGIETMDVYDDRIEIMYKNFGDSPNESGSIITKFTNYQFLKEEIRTSSNLHMLHVVMPEHIMHISVGGDQYEEVILNAKNDQLDVYLGVEFDYTYGDGKFGKYGFMAKYNPEFNNMDIFESWSS